MTEKKKINKIILLSFLLFVISLIFIDPIKIGICSQYDYDCDDMVAGIVVPVGLFSLISLFVLIISRWLNYIIVSWLRFSKYYLPIAAVLILLSPTTDSSIFGFDKEFMTWTLAGIYFVVSLGIIFFKRGK